MPSRNVIKEDTPDGYYHIYARGSSKQAVFLDERDFRYFEDLLARYLSAKPADPKAGYSYPSYRNKVELLAFCLMRNHFHILLHQTDAGDMTAFMRSLMTSYARYFNLRYKRSGPLFESRYKASRISQQSYLEHISRYIHLNPRYWLRYKHSSLPEYLGQRGSGWLQPQKITGLFKNPDEYLSFLNDYEEYKQILEEIKHELAE